MKKTILYIGSLLLLAVGVGGMVGATVPTGTADAACNARFLTFPAWYNGISDDCSNISAPDGNGMTKFIWTIVLNIIEIMLQAVAYIAVFFVIYGGFQFMTSNGAPDARAKAIKTILHALIGFAIAISAVALKNFVWDGVFRGAVDGTEIAPATIATNLLDLIYTIAAIIGVVVIVVAGINFATSAGDPGKAAKARQAILGAVIGIVVVVMAFAITKIVSTSLG